MSSRDYQKRIKLTDIEYQTRLEDVLRSLLAIVASGRREAVDLNGNGQIDPGDLPDFTWTAKELLSRGEHQLARILLARTVTEGSDDTEAQLVLEELERQDGRTRLQARRWNFFQKYLFHPFSKFNASMAVAFIVCEMKLPCAFMTIGEAVLDYAIASGPDSSDAHLLKGWYHFQKNENAAVREEAKKAIQIEPDYAKAWLGLGFFLEKCDRPGEAITAFHKLLDLYPCYSERDTISGVVSELEKRQSVDGAFAGTSDRKVAQFRPLPEIS